MLNRRISLQLAYLVALVAMGGMAASPAASDPIPLSKVAEKAKEQPGEQNPVDEQELSQSKSKQEAPKSPPPPAPAADDGLVVTTVAPLPVLPWGGFEVVRHLPIPEEGLIPIEEEPGYSEARVRVGAIAGGGGLTTGDLSGYGSGGLLLGWEESGWSLDLRGWYSRARASSSLDESFTDFRGWAGDLALRLWLAGDGTSMRPNVMIAGRLGSYRWDFRNPVTIPQLGNRTFSEDKIGFRSVLAGFGVEVLQGGGWSLGGTLAAGYQGFHSATDAGFENDLFDGGAVFEVVGELVYAPSH